MVERFRQPLFATRTAQPWVVRNEGEQHAEALLGVITAIQIPLRAELQKLDRENQEHAAKLREVVGAFDQHVLEAAVKNEFLDVIEDSKKEYDGVHLPGLKSQYAALEQFWHHNANWKKNTDLIRIVNAVSQTFADMPGPALAPAPTAATASKSGKTDPVTPVPTQKKRLKYFSDRTALFASNLTAGILFALGFATTLALVYEYNNDFKDLKDFFDSLNQADVAKAPVVPTDAHLVDLNGEPTKDLPPGRVVHVPSPETHAPAEPEARYASASAYRTAELNLGGVDTNHDGVLDGIAEPAHFDNPTQTQIDSFQDAVQKRWGINLTDGQARLALMDGGFVKDGMTYEIWESKQNLDTFFTTPVPESHRLIGNVMNVDTAILSSGEPIPLAIEPSDADTARMSTYVNNSFGKEIVFPDHIEYGPGAEGLGAAIVSLGNPTVADIISGAVSENYPEGSPEWVAAERLRNFFTTFHDQLGDQSHNQENVREFLKKLLPNLKLV